MRPCTRSRLIRVAPPALWAVLWSGCGPQPERQPRGDSASGPADPAPWSASATRVEADTPNLLIVLIDDLGADQVAAFGADDPIAMPTLDGLAADGLRFQHATSAPVCSPTRAELITGRWSHRSGVTTALDFRTQSYPGLPSTELALPAALAPAGVSSALVGKWHLATRAEGGTRHALDAGFAHHWGSLSNLGPEGSPTGQLMTYQNWEKVVDGDVDWTDVYATTDSANDAIALIGALPEPWFVLLSFNAAHAPWHQPPPELHPGPHPAFPSVSEMYVDAVEALDHELGRVIDRVDRDRTWIAVLGDNGTPTEVVGDHGKASVYEAGVRVPLVITGPGVDRGRDIPDLVAVVDLFPTALELMGAPEAPDLDGVSLVPLIEGTATRPHRDWVYAGRSSPPHSDEPDSLRRMVRDDRYKLIWSRVPGFEDSWELYDLSADPDELDDLLQSPLPPSLEAVRARLAGNLAAVLEPL